MLRNVIAVEEPDLGVSKDTAQPRRGIKWGLVTAAISLSIMAVLFMVLLWIGM